MQQGTIFRVTDEQGQSYTCSFMWELKNGKFLIYNRDTERLNIVEPEWLENKQVEIMEGVNDDDL